MNELSFGENFDFINMVILRLYISFSGFTKFIKPCFVLDIVLRLLHICASDISTTKIGLYDFSRNFIVDFRYFLNIFNKTSSESFTFFSIFTITIAVAPWLILSGNAVSMIFPFFN